MNYEQFLEQMKEDLQARFAEDGEAPGRILPWDFFPQRGLPGRGKSQYDRCLSGL